MIRNLRENWAGSTIELNVRKTSTKPTRQFDRSYMESRKSVQLKSGRVIQKNGVENINNLTMKGKSWKFFKDIVTTLVGMRKILIIANKMRLDLLIFFNQKIK